MFPVSEDDIATSKGRQIELSHGGPSNYVQVSNVFQGVLVLTDLNSTDSTWAVDGYRTITVDGKPYFYIETLCHCSCEVTADSDYGVGIQVSLTAST